ncbi:MAG: flagella basal body P-ring formation protein FlgA [Sulfitobacter sp.]|jgi:flagella basal body P-ring formation protein FlgA
MMQILQAALACLLLWAAPVQALTSKVTDLVEERAAAEMGRAIPANGRIDVRLAKGTVDEGEYIQEFWMDQQSGQFIANVISELGETQRVWGVAVMTVQVPVAARRVLPDEIITEADLTIVEMPLQRVGTFAAFDAKDILGQQVRRMLVAGRPIPRQSVIPPKIITRGQKVKILLNQGGLELSARGRAMSDAHLGQVLRVVNLSSNKAISAVATAAGVVKVDQ